MGKTNAINKDVINSGESILAKTETGYSIRVVVEYDHIHIIAVDYKKLLIEPHDANSFKIKMS